jgi:hypothetical protein
MRQFSIGVKSIKVLHSVKKEIKDKATNVSTVLFQTTFLLPAEFGDDVHTAWIPVELKAGSSHSYQVVLAPKNEKELKIKLVVPTAGSKE